MTTSTPFDGEIEWNRRRAAEGSVNAMNDLAMRLRDRHRHTGDPADLLEGIAQLRAALGYLPNHPVRPVLLANLSALLLDHFRLFGDVSALHQAVAGCDEAMPLLDEEDDPIVAAMVRTDALALLAEHTGESAYLAEAVESASRLPPVPAARLVLGRTLQVRYKLTGDRAALVDAAVVLAECLRARPVDDPNYSLTLNLLGDVLRHSALHTGDDSLRESAIRHLRSAVAYTPDGSDRQLDRKVDLAAALQDRSRQTGDLAALREAVAVLRDVLSGTRPGGRTWRNRCEFYLSAVHELVTQTGDIELLDQAVDIGESSRGDSRDAMIPLLLGLLHRERFMRTGSEPDLTRAIRTLTEVVDTVPYGEQDHVAALDNLGIAWLLAYEFSSDPEMLRRSVTALTSCVRACAPDRSERGDALFNYGEALLAQYERSLDPAILAAAGHSFHEAAQIEALRPIARIRAARAWARTEAELEQWHRARDAYAFAVGLLPLVVARRLAHVDQQRMLAELNGLAADAAASALWANDPQTAVRLLELGRGVLGGQLLQSRSDLSRLQAVAPQLAGRLRDAFDRLTPSGHLVGSAADERHDLDLRLRHLLDEARALPGFADFLAPPEIADLLLSTVDGPVVMINVSRLRSDALLVQLSGVTSVRLPGVTPESVAQQAAAFGAALAECTRPGTGETEAQATVTGVLGWLWDRIAEPVLTRLGHTTTPLSVWPRVWWSPVGQLALLPIHAAGHFPRGATVLDRVVSSYTPTLRALHHARARHRPAGDDLLIVATGNAPGAKALRGAEREATGIAALTSATRLDGAEATVDAVRVALTSHASAHFACHAANDPYDASAGHLLLHDGPLSVLDVSALDLSGVRLAVLSACETSLGTHRIPDEALHLVSAFQLAGYPEVVGTLWQVNDLVARLVAVDLHEGIVAGEGVGTALHHAVRRCRERFDKTPTLWAAYVHSGR